MVAPPAATISYDLASPPARFAAAEIRSALAREGAKAAKTILMRSELEPVRPRSGSSSDRMRIVFAALAWLLPACAVSAAPPAATISYDLASPPARFAAAEIRSALAREGHEIGRASCRERV